MSDFHSQNEKVKSKLRNKNKSRNYDSQINCLMILNFYLTISDFYEKTLTFYLIIKVFVIMTFYDNLPKHDFFIS